MPENAHPWRGLATAYYIPRRVTLAGMEQYISPRCVAAPALVRAYLLCLKASILLYQPAITSTMFFAAVSILALGLGSALAAPFQNATVGRTCGTEAR